jgi:sugar/nucleoside kinase (ribokinase family)
MRYDVSVVGLYILDILGRPVSAIPAGGNVDFIDQIRLTVAGTAGGTVVDCAKLGLKCQAVGAVGEDEKADFVLQQLSKFGIDTGMMQRLPGVPTSATILNIRPNGERPALHMRGASDHFDVPADVYDRVFDADIIHLGGTGLLRKLDGAPSVKFLAEAKKRGRITTFDLIAARPETIGIVGPILPYIDYFMPSIEEARDMSGLKDVGDVARFYLDRGATTCVFTMGGEGSFVATGDVQLRIPAFEVEVVDTTGCGDAYDAGFIAALQRGYDLENCARFASAASGLVATGLGSDAGIVSFDDTLEKMRTLRIKKV